MIPTKLTHARQLEFWLCENYPIMFEDWELTASEVMDLWDWLEQENWAIVDEFKRAYRKRLEANSGRTVDSI